MRQLLMATCVPGIWIISFLEFALFSFILVQVKKTGSRIHMFTAAITFGLFYDALIIALGSVINAGSIPLVISRIRFLSHGILVPLLIAICAEALELKGAAKKIFYAITIVLVIAGLAEALVTRLDVTEIAGITRMSSVKGETPMWAEKISSLLSFGTVIPLMIAGVVVWIKQKTPFLFLSGFLMFTFAALGPATGNMDFIFYVSMFGELLMVVFLMLYGMKKSAE